VNTDTNILPHHMERLPVELLGQICSELCLHCTEPHAFPHADTTEARVTKTSLARFSTASHYIRAVAQPYLFHYYATGNLASAIRLMEPSLEESENDHLPSFLGAIIQHPDLAAHVKALQLLPSCRLDDFTEIDMDVIHGLANHADHIDRTSPGLRMLIHASKEIGAGSYNVFHPDFWSQLGRPHRDPRIYQPKAEQIHHTLEQLALLLCPNVRTLVLGVTSINVRFWPIIEFSGRTLPSLMKVALLPLSGAAGSSVGHLIPSAAPNIEILHVAPRPHSVASVASILPSVRPMPSLLKLVASDITVGDLARLVVACGELHDLEYRPRKPVYFSEFTLTDGPAILGALRPARKTLRRLLLVSMTKEYPGAALMIQSHAAIESLSELNQLEELTISHFYVKRSLGTRITTNFAGFLPRSIKHVHLMFIVSNITADLEKLARDAPTELPNLRSIRISHRNYDDDPSHVLDEWFRVLEGQYKRCQELLAVVHIKMTWDKLSYRVPRDEGAPGCEVVGTGSYLGMPHGFWGSP
jgi:hypothetical protein